MKKPTLPRPLPMEDHVRAFQDAFVASHSDEAVVAEFGANTLEAMQRNEASRWRLKLGLPLILALLGCPPSAPPKSTPDAADGAPTVGADAAVMTPCQAAWNALDAVHCTVPYSLLAKVDGNRGFLLEPDGAPLTCEGIAGVKTAQDAIALGIPCGGQ